MKIVIGTFSEHMANIGSELITELSKVSLLVYDMRDEMPDSFLSSLDTSGIKSATEGLVVPKGKPRYVNGRLSTLHPKMFAREFAWAESTLMGTRVVLL
jgi:hypothetical protein